MKAPVRTESVRSQDVIELENYLRLLSSSCTSSCQVSLLPDQTPAERASSRPARGSPPNVEE
ncbi:unnamed protein product [Durusdinium trenchii]|uniref:Uncharacterized protein n=1 Tax=Durusdinium trenchii TaxID=1381693 RepID=A0ABP0RCE6_9DINO